MGRTADLLARTRRSITSGGTVFVLPAAFLSLVIIAYPFGQALWLSFTDHTVASAETNFVGLKNYGVWLSRAIFWQTVKNTIVYAGGTVLCGIVLGFAVGLSLHRLKFTRDVLGALILLPWIIVTVVSTLVWMWMFNPFAGLLNYVMTQSGIFENNINWLGGRTLAMLSVIAVSAWRYTPYFGVVILAARKEVPQQYYEAAVTDGANNVQQFWHITMPAVLKVLFFTAVLVFIRVAYDFVVVYILTRGGPSGATQIISVLTFSTAFESGRMGAGVAAPLLLFPLFGPLILFATGNMVRQSLGEK